MLGEQQPWTGRLQEVVSRCAVYSKGQSERGTAADPNRAHALHQAAAMALGQCGHWDSGKTRLLLGYGLIVQER